MSTPTLYDIADELNRRAVDHPIGMLQELRGHRPGNDLFRVNSQTTQDRWACHWGGRTELQFNIGLEGTSNFRHGVAFDFGSSRSYSFDELAEKLKPKIKQFNRFVLRHPEVCHDMDLWAWDGNKQESVHESEAGPIPLHLVADNVFIFLGKISTLRGIDCEHILNDFDRLMPLYRYVESHGKYVPASVPLETHFAFRPGCRTKKRSTIVRQCRAQIERDLRHNALQKALYRKLVRRFGKDNVGAENQGVHGTSIDLVVRQKRTYWFYEIKTASTPRGCIREALGQLLEYAFWPGSQKAARLIVASDCPLDKDGARYLRRLNEKFTLPLYYEHIKL